MLVKGPLVAGLVIPAAADVLVPEIVSPDVTVNLVWGYVNFEVADSLVSVKTEHLYIWCWHGQCSAKALEKWGQMTHTIEKYGDTFVILPIVNLKFVGTWAPTAKMIGDIPDFNMLNVPKTQPHNPWWVF